MEFRRLEPAPFPTLQNGLMLLITFLVLLVLSLGQWLLSPLIHVVTPLLSLAWVGWALLAVALWLFAGYASDDPLHPRN